nr:MAG TPA: hypothetical protein [Caudoviricetes sp.]
MKSKWEIVSIDSKRLFSTKGWRWPTTGTN